MDLSILNQELKIHWGIEGSLSELYGEKDLNYFVSSSDKSFVLKLHHPETSKELLDAQDILLNHLESLDLNISLPKVVQPLENSSRPVIEIGEVTYQLRLLTWVEGRLYSELCLPTPEILEELGYQDGLLTASLNDLEIPVMERKYNWIPSEVDWIREHLSVFGKEERQIIEFFLELFSKSSVNLPGLRKSLIYMDANDNNILVTEGRVSGFIDFGDASYTYTINELAVTLAYAMMNFPDPLNAGRKVINGFHRGFNLREDELGVLYVLTAARLMISVTFSALRRLQNPDNEYHQVSDGPAWDLLKKWQNIHPAKALAFFRHECGFEPVEGAESLTELIASHDFSFPLGDQYKSAKHGIIDLSVGSTELGNVSDFIPKIFENHIQERCKSEELQFLAGGYLETRVVYSTPAFSQEANWGREWRTVHLGHDYWLPAGSEVFAVETGTVISAYNNTGEGNYGPTIIVEHTLEGRIFFTLYGHLSQNSLVNISVGMTIQKGQKIGELGVFEENGNWVPHLHFQLLTDLWGEEHDFPGVAFYGDKEVMGSLCPDPGLISGIFDRSEESDLTMLLEKRHELLGKNLSVSYKKPLVVQRGYMQYLYDHTGRRYLDTVNNVAHVGHQHPRVVEAIKRQASVLNTNTRYLHSEILQYAEKLASLFPSPLEVCFFVNSGSEANELALRMARNFTGRQSMMVMEMGYHGNTAACIEVSSYKFDRKGGKGKPESISILESPDTFRKPEFSEHYRDSIDNSFKDLNQAPAGVISESILSCAGQIVPPEGYYKYLFEQTRKKGGLFIADEVQVGFGRVGSAMWGFELHDIVPDIVTLGKPIGNGHPLGAVVTTREIAESFANGMEFFNTFGGNPVSCAVGREVLRVIEEDGLQEHAFQMGNALKSGLGELQSEFNILADIRGHGLFLGFELMRENRPLTQEAGTLVNRMRQRGILMSTDGPDENVIKIKPPMCIQMDDIDHLLHQLQIVLKDL